jgi:hypothetical protein
MKGGGLALLTEYKLFKRSNKANLIDVQIVIIFQRTNRSSLSISGCRSIHEANLAVIIVTCGRAVDDINEIFLKLAVVRISPNPNLHNKPFNKKEF